MHIQKIVKKRELAVMALSNALSNGLIAFTNIILASLLNPSDYGITRIAGSYTFLMLLTSHFAMYDAICGKLRRATESENIALTKTACVMSIALALVSIILFSVYAKFFSDWTASQANQIIFITSSVIILAPTAIASNTLQLYGDNTTFSKYQLSNGLSQFMAGTSLTYFAGVTGWAVSRSMSAAIGFLVCIYNYLPKYNATLIDLKSAFTLIKTSVFHVVSGLCSIFVLCGDIILLDWTCTNKDTVGAYGLAATLCKATYFIPNILGKYKLRSLISTDIENQKRLCSQYKNQIFLAGLASALITYLGVFILTLLGIFSQYPNLLYYTMLCSIYTPLAFYWTAIYTTNLARGVNAGFAYQGISAAFFMLVVYFYPKSISAELNTALSVTAGYLGGIGLYFLTQPKKVGINK